MSDTVTPAAPAPGAASALLNPSAPPAATPAAPAATQAPASTVAPGSIRFMSDAFHKDGQFNEGWSENFEKAGLGRLAKIGMKYKDEGEFWKGLDHMAQFVGKKAGHLPPNESSTPEEIAEYRKQVGVPEEPTGYKFKPENLPPGSEWNDALSAKAEAVMHAHNIPEKFAPELAKLSGEFMQDMADKAKAKFDETMDTYAADSEARFKKEWGPEYSERHTQNIEFAKAHFGEDEFNSNAYLRAALCMPGVMELLDIARREVRGAGLPGAGGEITNSMSIQQQIDEYCAANPDWARVPHKDAHVTKLINLQTQRAKR